MRLAVLVACLLSGTVNAGSVTTALVTHEGGHYFVEVDALVEVPESEARRLLTDYANLDRVNPSVEISEVLITRGPRDYRVRTVTKACVWFFCKRINQVQDVTEGLDGSIVATVIPEQSDLRHGYARVDMWAQPEGTRILIRSEVEPDFWIPPLIGPWVIKKKLRSEALDTVFNIERVVSSSAVQYNSAPVP